MTPAAFIASRRTTTDAACDAIELLADIRSGGFIRSRKGQLLGVWGADLFSDDVACDIRDHYRQLLEDSVEDSAATQLTLEKFERYLEEPDGVALIAFAVTQSKLGRLEPDIRDRALAIIDAGADLAVLSGLAAGDVLALALPRRLVLLRVVRVRTHRRGETPVLEELDFDGTEVPARDALERLGPKVNDPINLVHPSSSDTRIFAFVMEHIDWQRAGFRKVQTITSRAGDDQAGLPNSGISWAELAERYRRQAAQ